MTTSTGKHLQRFVIYPNAERIDYKELLLGGATVEARSADSGFGRMFRRLRAG